jgi:hypothetical protein
VKEKVQVGWPFCRPRFTFRKFYKREIEKKEQKIVVIILQDKTQLLDPTFAIDSWSNHVGVAYRLGGSNGCITKPNLALLLVGNAPRHDIRHS